MDILFVAGALALIVGLPALLEWLERRERNCTWTLPF